MSEPKQYNISSLHPHIIEDKNGFMIYYEDYASLKAEVQTLRHQAVHDVSQLGEQSAEIAHLKAENEELHKDYEALADEHTKLIDRNARPKAEVERLRKAGDLLCFHYISLARKRWPDDPLPPSVTDWEAAKNGKPSV